MPIVQLEKFTSVKQQSQLWKEPAAATVMRNLMWNFAEKLKSR